MEVIYTIIICIILAFTIYLVLKNAHENEMKELAAECSTRIQEMNRELVLVCTEPDSAPAQEVILRLRLNKTAIKLAEHRLHPEMSPTEEKAYEEERIKNQFIPH